MDTRTGEILTPEVAERLRKDLQHRRFIKPMNIPPTPTQRRRGKIGRNEPCPCGSGKKFKKCCWAGKVPGKR